jgi:hypothetical protein
MTAAAPSDTPDAFTAHVVAHRRYTGIPITMGGGPTDRALRAIARADDQPGSFHHAAPRR